MIEEAIEVRPVANVRGVELWCRKARFKVDLIGYRLDRRNDVGLLIAIPIAMLARYWEE